MNDLKHKLGIIGYGGMAGWHQTNCKRLDGFKAVAAYDIDPAQLERAKADGLTPYNSAEELLAQDDVDIILVATPNNFHKEYSIMAMNAGKTVVCEKPVAMNCGELQEMIDASKKNNVIFTVHQNRRWDTDFNIVKKAIAEGLVGKPYTIESRVHGQNGVVAGWRAYKVAGGGMLLDWGVHLIDQIMFMINEKVTEVYCNLHKIKTPEVDDYDKLILRFESGLTAQIEVGTYCLQPMPRWYINGDGGSLILNGWECDGKIVHAKQMELDWEPEIVQTAAGPTRTMAPRPKETLSELPLPEIKTDWIEFYRNVIDTMDGKAQLAVTPDSVMRVLRVIDAAFESDEKGTCVKVNV